MVARPSTRFPLRALQAFEAAARLGSFQKAALELGVTPAAISHHVKGLETQLGLLLFDRLHRALRLTPPGTRLSEAARRAFTVLDNTLDELTGEGLAAGPRTLSVSAAPSFAAKWLAPRIHRFQGLHPDIVLRLQASDVLADLSNVRTVDVALRYGQGPYGEALEQVRLFAPGRMLCVCAPSLAASGRLREPPDLLSLSLLRTQTPKPLPDEDEDGGAFGWTAWLAAAGIEQERARKAVAVGPLFGSTLLALEAAGAARGAALAPDVLVRDDLRTGKLAQPFQISIPDAFSYWLLFRRDRGDERRIRTFARWLRDEARDG